MHFNFTSKNLVGFESFTEMRQLLCQKNLKSDLESNLLGLKIHCRGRAKLDVNLTIETEHNIESSMLLNKCISISPINIHLLLLLIVSTTFQINVVI
jgi:hypothetical protein